MELDIRTIIAAFGMVVWINAAIIALAWYYAKTVRDVIGYWSISQLLFGITVTLISLRGMISDFSSVIISNMCLMGAHAAVQEGIACYMGRAGYLRKNVAVVLGVYLVVVLVLTYMVPSVALRVILYSMGAIVISLMSIVTLRLPGEKADAPRQSLVAVFVIIILLMLFRIGVAVVQGGYEDLMQAGFWQALGMLGMLGAYSSLSLGLFLLIVNKLGIEVQKQAMTDPLTKVFNRRALNEYLERRLPLKQRENMGIIMLDVDNFKEINDKFGHQAGDLYLIELSNLIQQNMREGDSVFRYAGDEFVIVAENVDQESLEQISERLEVEVAAMTLVWMESHKIATTISNGLALADDMTQNADELMRLADNDLYKAKSKRKKMLEIVPGH